MTKKSVIPSLRRNVLNKTRGPNSATDVPQHVQTPPAKDWHEETCTFTDGMTNYEHSRCSRRQNETTINDPQKKSTRSNHHCSALRLLPLQQALPLPIFFPSWLCASRNFHANSGPRSRPAPSLLSASTQAALLALPCGVYRTTSTLSFAFSSTGLSPPMPFVMFPISPLDTLSNVYHVSRINPTRRKSTNACSPVDKQESKEKTDTRTFYKSHTRPNMLGHCLFGFSLTTRANQATIHSSTRYWMCSWCKNSAQPPFASRFGLGCALSYTKNKGQLLMKMAWLKQRHPQG